ncbi:MAG: nuclear transport factor 2 family protein [Hydrogenophaga sp.]|uniref:nuclear transport factor 2 family protein n=1 Tax=Hydrogenophaga sp. TaxID=1904254 RepID=UPI00272F4806|nr:nuclear transport factor 2 family protein [Hydrogenophaga sp.]MDP2165348.1 nuclear transport factor 2 family protein [Hydrogenophaga sp.]MDP3477779.1 nuclear transport factor 2 family protein [Hydrogenophaga sp.]
MSQINPEQIERFMSGQVRCWNNHNKPGLLALYREMAPAELNIEYVGRAQQADGWLVIEEMFDKHNHQFRLEVVNTIINGSEAAVHHRNCIVGTSQVIESIETYRFGPGTLHVRYFLQPPKDASVNLEQFRGFAANTTQDTP